MKLFTVTSDSKPSLLAQWLKVGAVVSALSLAVAGCTSVTDNTSTEAPATLKVKIGWQPGPNAALMMLPIDEGWYEDEDLEVTAIRFASGAAMLAALKSGDIDFADIGAVPTTSAIATGDIDLTILGVSSDTTNNDLIVAKEGIKSIRDLKGKRVASPFGTAAYYTLLKALEGEGMSVKDVNYLNLDATAMVAAFNHGDIDAASGWSPFTYQMITDGGVSLGNGSDFKAYVPTLLVSPTAFANANKDTVVRFMRAVDKAQTELQDGKTQKSIDALVKHLNLDAETAKKMVTEGAEFASTERQLTSDYSLNLTGGLQDALNNISKFLFDAEVLSENVDMSNHVDASFAKASVE